MIVNIFNLLLIGVLISIYFLIKENKQFIKQLQNIQKQINFILNNNFHEIQVSQFMYLITQFKLNRNNDTYYLEFIKFLKNCDILDRKELLAKKRKYYLATYTEVYFILEVFLRMTHMQQIEIQELL